jgi:hypothetical protein
MMQAVLLAQAAMDNNSLPGRINRIFKLRGVTAAVAANLPH